MKKNICEQILYVLSDIKQNRKNEKNGKHKTWFKCNKIDEWKQQTN